MSAAAAPLERPCKACGLPLVFGRSAHTGKTLPLQRVRRVYLLAADGTARLLETRGALAVSHFEGCPDASRFSRGRRPGPGAA